MPCSRSPACASRACRRATRLCLEMLDRLDGGAIAVELPDGVRVRAGHGALVAHLRVRDHAVFDEVLARGDIGFGETWMDGLWETEDLPGLLRLLSANRARLQGAIYGRLFRLLSHRLQHLLRANTRSGSRRNIEAHYDLGNDFYALGSTPPMTYSAAVFASPDESLADAQLRKYRRILGELGVSRGRPSWRWAAAGAASPRSPPPSSAARCSASRCRHRSWSSRARAPSAAARPTGWTSSCATTATCAASTTTWCGSR